MSTALEQFLEVVERQYGPSAEVAGADRAEQLQVAIRVHTTILEVLENRIGGEDLAERHRPLVPVFQRWLEAARQLMASARRLRAEGGTVTGLDDLARAMNRSKLVAESFDHFVALNEHLARGNPPGSFGTYRPLDEVIDGLRD